MDHGEHDAEPPGSSTIVIKQILPRRLRLYSSAGLCFAASGCAARAVPNHSLSAGLATLVLSGLFYVRSYRRLAASIHQTLILDRDGLIWKLGATIERRAWSDIKALKRTGPTDSGQNGYGLSVICKQHSQLDLNGLWAIKRETLIPIMIERARLVTEQTLPIYGAKVEFSHLARLMTFTVAILILPAIGLMVLAATLIHQHHG